MDRVYAQCSQIPGTFLFKCPHCDFLFNLLSDESKTESEVVCPECKKPFTVVFAVDATYDPHLHSELERAKPIGGEGAVRVFQCPYCRAASITLETPVLMGEEPEKQYVCTCVTCGRDYVRDLGP